MTRALLAPLQLLYAAALRAKNARHDQRDPLRLRWPVISVGNLSVGGAGKTPLVIHLTRLLEGEGWSVDVLSRGYGRNRGQVERVDAAGDAARFGDEPLMIAQAGHAPVFVGASRYQAGLLAERELSIGPRRVHLLDDGFQHRLLARTVDIVAVHPSDLDERLLPAGRLREPLAALKRADVIVLREEDAEFMAKFEPYVRSGACFWRVRRRLSAPGAQKRVLAFCAIARPQEFFKALEAGGARVVERVSFRDHHRYTKRDVGQIAKLGQRQGCEGFVITEKDAVKLDAALRATLTAIAPLCIARLSLEIAEEATAVAQLAAKLGPDGGGSRDGG